jgi:hypothetical protein
VSPQLYFSDWQTSDDAHVDDYAFPLPPLDPSFEERAWKDALDRAREMFDDDFGESAYAF